MIDFVGVLTRHLKKDDAILKLKTRVSGKIGELMKKSENEMDLTKTLQTPEHVLDYLKKFLDG